MTTITPTGRRERRGDRDYVVLTRAFRAPVEDVWAAVTEPERLERWIGTWTGDPSTGQVAFRMTAEGEDAEAEIQRIDVCEPPHRLVTRSVTPGPDGTGEIEWVLELDLTESDGVTTLTFAQVVHDAEMASTVGPGWSTTSTASSPPRPRRRWRTSPGTTTTPVCPTTTGRCSAADRPITRCAPGGPGSPWCHPAGRRERAGGAAAPDERRDDVYRTVTGASTDHRPFSPRSSSLDPAHPDG